MMRKIKFSFIIPTLNEERYIGDCLKSIKKQTKNDYEIIVVDSYSKDNTVKIAKKYGCVVIYEKRKGPGVARNSGAKKAKGGVLVFADADARFDSDFILKLEEKFRKCIGGCIFRQTLFDARKSDLLFLKLWNFLIRLANSIGFTMTNGVCFAYRKKYFSLVNGFDIRLLTNEDHDLARRVAKHARFIFVNDIAVKTSVRRAKKLGIIKFIVLQVKATLFYFLNHKSFAGYWQ